MDLGLRDKVAMVTGASRGLGHAMARALAQEGARLSICARGAEGLKAAASELTALGYDVFAEPADITDSAQARRWVENTVKHYGGVDILVNNAGGARHGTLAELSEAAWRESFDANFFSAIGLARISRPKSKGAAAVRSSTSARSMDAKWVGRSPTTPPRRR